MLSPEVHKETSISFKPLLFGTSLDAAKSIFNWNTLPCMLGPMLVSGSQGDLEAWSGKKSELLLYQLPWFFLSPHPPSTQCLQFRLCPWKLPVRSSRQPFLYSSSPSFLSGAGRGAVSGLQKLPCNEWYHLFHPLIPAAGPSDSLFLKTPDHSFSHYSQEEWLIVWVE